MQADVCRIAKLLQKLFWKHNHEAASENAKKMGRWDNIADESRRQPSQGLTNVSTSRMGSLRRPIPAPTNSPFFPSSRQNDDDSDENESEEDCAPTPAQSRKRGRGDGSDEEYMPTESSKSKPGRSTNAIRKLRKPTKQSHTSMSPELDRNKSPTVAWDPDDTPARSLPPRRRRSPLVASKTPNRFRGAFTSPSETLPSGSPNGNNDGNDDIHKPLSSIDHVGHFEPSEEPGEPIEAPKTRKVPPHAHKAGKSRGRKPSAGATLHKNGRRPTKSRQNRAETGESAFLSPAETLTSGSPNCRSSNPKDLMQRKNDLPGSSISEQTLQPAHDERVPSLSVTEPSGHSTPPSPSRSEHDHPIQVGNVKTRVVVLVKASCDSGGKTERWRGGKIKEQRLSDIFDKLSTITSRSDIESINFTLKALGRQDEAWSVDRGDMTVFDFMKQDFDEIIRQRKNEDHRILLEPRLEQQGGGVGADVSRDSESDDDSTNW